MKITKKINKKLDRIAEIASYSLDWIADPGDASHDYVSGAIETIGCTIACCLVQWVPVPEGVATSDVVTLLKLREFPSREVIKARLVELLLAEQ